METQLWAMCLVIFATLVGSIGPILLKKASGQLSLNFFSIIKNKFLIFGILAYAAGTILFIPALKGGELSVLYPIISLSYVWVSLLSVKLLKEKMSSLKWIGVGLIILGVSLIGLGGI